MSINQNRILLLTSNPEDLPKLNLNGHIDSIQKILDSKADMFNVRHYTARQSNIQRVLQDFQPHYIHFIGHGCDEGLYLENEDRNSELLPNDAIVSLFENNNTIKCVLLMSCYTESVSDVIGNYVQYVIGMKEKVYLETGDRFSEGFYRSLVNGETIEKSFFSGRTNIQISNLQDDALVFRIKNRNKYLLRVSEKTFSTFREYRSSSESLYDYIRRIIAGGIKTEKKIYPDTIQISNISFDQSTLTVLLPLSYLEKETMSDDFIDVESFDNHVTDMLTMYVRRISHLKDVHHNLHDQLRVLQTLGEFIKRLHQNVSLDRRNPKQIYDNFEDIKSHLQIYQDNVDEFVTFSENQQSFNRVPLKYDENRNVTDGPEWAIDILNTNYRMQMLFKEIYSNPTKKTSENYFIKINALFEEYQKLNSSCNDWLKKVDNMIRENAAALLGLMGG